MMKPTMTRLIAATAVLANALAAAPMAAAASNAGAFHSVLIETKRVQPPRGFAELCARRPEVCPTRSTAAATSRIESLMREMFGPEAVAVDAPGLTLERFQTLQRVNAAVNAAIRPARDPGGDRWALTSTAGDCEEYVLLKRESLARLGWPRAALRATVVRRPDRGHHAVLVVSTQGGEFVLDNLSEEIVEVRDSAYEFVVSQSLEHPGEWATVRR